MSDTDKWYISGPLGVGAAEPQQMLDVKGNIAITEYPGGMLTIGREADHRWSVLKAEEGRLTINEGSWGKVVIPSGNVGIGTTDPKERLQIGDRFTFHDGGHKLIAYNLYYGGDPGRDRRIVQDESAVLRFTDAGDILAQTASSGDAESDIAWTTGLFIKNDGNIGIGTDPVSGKLQFDNSGGNKVVVYDDGTDRYGFGLNSGNLNAFVPAGGRFSIRQNGHDGTEVMTVTGVGNVGIGTTAPTHPLHLKAGWSFVALDTNVAGQDSGIRLMEAGAVKWHIWNAAGGANLRIQRDGASFPALAIDQNSNVGIGGQLKVIPSLSPTQAGGVEIGDHSSLVTVGVYPLDANSNTMRVFKTIEAHGYSRFLKRVTIDADLLVGGSKNFVQTNPVNPNQEIVYASLEGGEAGTYLRGTGKLDNGKSIIVLPQHFTLVTSEEGLTAQLTPKDTWLQLYTAQISTKQIVVHENQGKSGEFDYLIQGIRKGYENHQVIRDKTQ